MADQPLPAPPSEGQPSLHHLVTTVCAPAMVLSGPDGQLRAAGAQGAYVDDTRILSALGVTVGGVEPEALAVSSAAGPRATFWSVCPADSSGPEPKLLLARHRQATPTGLLETFTLRSYSDRPVRRRLEVTVACDLAGTGTVKGGGTGRAQVPRQVGQGLGWDAPELGSVLVTAEPAPVSSLPAKGLMAWELEVGPQGQASVCLTVEVTLPRASKDRHPGAAGSPRPSGNAVVSAPGARLAWGQPRVGAADRRLARFVEVSLADLESLQMAVPGAPTDIFLGAGAPWYLTLFGRDSIWAARMLLPLGTSLALGTLRALARYQGTKSVPRTGEEPGKILHELRRAGSSGAGTATGHSLPPVYYGTVDATALWVCLLHDAWRWGAPDHEVRSLLGPMMGCLRWVRDFGCTGSGFVTYVDTSGRGLGNQGWKDSGDSVRLRDGRLAAPPVALCEVQGYAYEAAMAGAALLEAFSGAPETVGEEPGEWRTFAHSLAARFREHFWVEDEHGPYPAIALDRDGRPQGSLTSNMGHLLGTGILGSAEEEVVSRRLGLPELDSGFGLRTMANSSGGYNPLSYHCGSVWGHDTAIAISGLARTGSPVAQRTAASLAEGLLSAAEAFEYRLPELFGGHQRSEAGRPLPYPPACRPQAWTAAAAVALVTALAGLVPDVPKGTVFLCPVPSSIGLQSISGLRLGEHTLGAELGPDGQGRLSPAPEGIRVLS